MGKLSKEFKVGVLNKMRNAHVTLLNKPVGSINSGWVKERNSKKGSINDIELKPEIKALVKSCGATIELDGSCDPSYAFRRSTGQEVITVPWPHQFESEEAFYRVLLHEMSHWTGREKRLNREMGELDCCKYHSALGAVEEVTAELSSVLLAEHFGFVPHYARSVDYVNGYLGHIAKMAPDDKKELFLLASHQAEEAAEYLLSLT